MSDDPAQYLSSSPVRDDAAITYLSTLVPNPFFGLLPTGFTAATVARSQLLRPYPQFNNVPTYGSDGTSRYDSSARTSRAMHPKMTMTTAISMTKKKPELINPPMKKPPYA